MLSRELTAASAKPLVLAILSKGESYGYEIIQRVKDLSNGNITWTDGMLYPVLHRLQRQKFITAEWKIAETGRKRKYYFITEKGVHELARERQQWTVAHETLAKLWTPETCLT